MPITGKIRLILKVAIGRSLSDFVIGFLVTPAIRAADPKKLCELLSMKFGGHRDGLRSARLSTQSF
jgi:hypothetical protein